jgi:ribosomal protein L29
MMKAKDISKLTKEEATKKLGELHMSLLELEKNSTKKRSVKKSIARLKTHLHKIEKKVVKK